MLTISHNIAYSLPIASNNFARRTRTRKTRASIMMDQPSPMKGFPYLPSSQKELMNQLTSSIDADVGPTLLPSEVAADVLYYENEQGTSQGALDIRSGSPNSTIDFILTSWLHCKLPTGDINISTILGFLNATTDAPHLLIEFIQGTPTSLILIIDVLHRKDPVLHPEYLDEYYNNTNILDNLRHDLEELPQINISPYRSSSLYIRSMLSPTAVAVSINCESESCLEEIVRVHVGRTCKEVVEFWMGGKCARNVKEIGNGEKDGLVRRDGLIKKMFVESNLAANMPRLFGDDVTGKVVAEIQKACRIE